MVWYAEIKFIRLQGLNSTNCESMSICTVTDLPELDHKLNMP
jgi:hypothetical protein